MMFMSDVHKREECMGEATQDLRRLGVKSRPKKSKVQTTRSAHRAFKVSLRQLQMLTVTLKSGQQIVVPRLVHELCSFILTKVETEGLFRKEGSKGRQSEIKKVLDVGKPLGLDHHVIDVAVVLKLFLRELTEPLIPYGYHELFLRCVLLEKKKLDAILLACLLLPIEHLNTLSYLMLFFSEVAEYSNFNKMNPYNLAVVIGPTVFPVEEKLSPNPQLRIAKTNEIFQLLIENASRVGVIPEDIIDRLGNSRSHPSDDSKKKKRRSGSLTRMFSGLKKIVGGKSGDENIAIVTPDLLITPINSVKKRRVGNNGISNKKKKELINKLPDNTLLNTPFTPCRTPVCMNQSGAAEIQEIVLKEKERRWFSRSKSVKNLTKEDHVPKKSTLERRWSGIATQATNLRNRTKKRNSCAASLINKTIANDKQNRIAEPDYIRVPIVEYEEIKNRVSVIERRISQELESVQSKMSLQQTDNEIDNVQSAYEQTLVQAEHLSPTTDHLAKRLSRELKIRRSADQKIIRSPSARKIGSLRRRSREIEKNVSETSKLIRHQSWHVGTNNSRQEIPRVSLKQGKPNTVPTGLPTSLLLLETKDIQGNIVNNKISRSSSYSDRQQGNKIPSCNLSGSSNDTWVSAENFFATLKSCNSNSNNNNSNNVSKDDSRASLAKLRSQNAGMVLAKAKLFDKLDSSTDISNNSSDFNPNSVKQIIPRIKIGSNKNGRNMDSRLSYRVRALKYEDRRISRKSMSPRKRFQQQKFNLAQKYLNDGDNENVSDKENSDCNRVLESSGKITPRAPMIKKSLGVKSPKRLCRTPGVERSTPLRVLKTPSYNV